MTMMDQPKRFTELPTEIIHQIFYWALEPNLIFTCRQLYRTFCDELVFRNLILLAFFQSDGIAPVEKKHFPRYRPLSSDEREHLQGLIFRYAWCTRDRINACLPALSRLAMFQAWHRELNDPYWKGHQPVKPIFGTMWESQFMRALSDQQPPSLRALPDLNDEEGMAEHYFALEKASTDSDRGFKESIMVW